MASAHEKLLASAVRAEITLTEMKAAQAAREAAAEARAAQGKK